MTTPTLFLSLERIGNVIRLDLGRGPGTRSFEVGFDSIRDIVEKVEHRYSDASPEDIFSVGRSLYGWLNGDNRFSDALARLSTSGVIALAIEAKPGLLHLPWETLHDGVGFVVAHKTRPIIPVRVWETRTDLPAIEPANRALRVLFMASAPENIEPVLEFEKEEGDILDAAREIDSQFELVVEESGTLGELNKTILHTSHGAFDVVHLSGHAGFKDGKAVFLLENDIGEVDFANGDKIADALPRKPRLVFLSGCQTAHETGVGSVRTLAEHILDAGTDSVLGWARPVRDKIAIAAARALYTGLAVGEELPSALSKTYRTMLKEEVTLREQFPEERIRSNWHLLRLFVRHSVPGAYVTTLETDLRKPPRKESYSDAFITPLTEEIRAIPREKFVGRRRLLQRSLKVLKGREKVGVVLHGLGGNGKTCIAARICDRLNQIGTNLSPVVLVGRVKESDLVGKLVNELNDYKDLRDILTDVANSGDSLEIRLTRALNRAPATFLFVLDDFEQNYSDGAGGYAVDSDGNFKLADDTRALLSALVKAVGDLKNTRRHRIILTSRFKLDGPDARRFAQESVNAFRDGDLNKLVLGLRLELDERLKQAGSAQYTGTERRRIEVLAVEIAGGNARLLRWLFELIPVMKQELPEILGQMMADKREELLEIILARKILDRQPEATKKFLGTAAVYDHFAPRQVFEELARELAGVEGDFDRSVAVGLLETVPDLSGEPVFQVPSVVRHLLKPFEPTDQVKWHARAAELLYNFWWGKEGRNTIPLADELVRLARKGQLPNIAARVEDFIQQLLMGQNRFKEASFRLEKLPKEALNDYALEMAQARIAQFFGDGMEARRHFEEALKNCPEGSRSQGFLLLMHADYLKQQGQFDDALDCYRNVLIPLFEKTNNTHQRAVTFGRIADILHERGDLNGALRIRQEEEIPVFENLGNIREKVVARGKVADILFLRGDLTEALRIRQEEELPVYSDLVDKKAWAATKAKVAEIIHAQGNVDEALKIYQGEVLPICEELGDAQMKGVVLGRVADILIAIGDLKGALTKLFESVSIREKLGDLRGYAVIKGKIADILFAQDNFVDSLKIRFEVQLPIFEKLGDKREQAVTFARIADIMEKVGELPQALRIRQTEELPVYNELGDVESRAVALVKISRIFAFNGDFDQALENLTEAISIFEGLKSPKLEIAQNDFQLVQSQKAEAVPKAIKVLQPTGSKPDLKPPNATVVDAGPIERGGEFVVPPFSTAGTGVPNGYQVCRVFFGTNRDRDLGALETQEVFLPRGDVDRVSYGSCEVSIPESHKMGKLESPSVIGRWVLGENPKKHIVLLKVIGQAEKVFFDSLSECVTKSVDKSAFVFVHGYNVTFEDAARRTAQIHYDLRFPGAPIFYSWPSEGAVEGYTRDENRIDQSQRHLRQFLSDVVARSGAESLFLIAHSMGNRALTKAFIELAEADVPLLNVIREIILAAPDIDARVFKNDIGPAMVRAGCPITLYAASNDKALKASHFVHGDPRAGDSGNNIVLLPGIESIDASAVNTSFLGHAPFAEERTVLSDMFGLIRNRLRADQRELVPVLQGSLKYWQFPA